MSRRLPRALALVLLFSAALPAEIRTLTILHSNDLHARFLPLENKHGGFAYLATLLKRERAGCTDCIYLNAGDLVQGSPVSTIFHGMPVYQVANLLGIDAATLGNHEFDYAWMQTKKFLSTAKYPIVSANLVNANGKLMTKPYVILKVNGLRIGVIGAMTERLKSLTTPKTLGPWRTLPIAATVRKYEKELRASTDLVVVLAHVTPREEEELLKAVPEVSVWISGHEHEEMKEPSVLDGRILVRVKGYGEELGRLKLKVDTVTKKTVIVDWRHIVVDSTKLQPDPAIAKQVQHWEDEVTTRVDQPIAVSTREYSKVEGKALIERIMRDQTGADFAYMNSGGVRDILPKGQIRARHIWNIMPFDNMLVVGTFKGSQLPAKVVGDRKVDPNRDYTLAMTDFSVANQETDLKVKGLEFPNDVGLLRDVMLDWFRKKKTID